MLRRFRHFVQAPNEVKRLRQELTEANERLALQRQRIRRLRKSADAEIPRLNVENFIWIFGTARSGNTWLSRMMKELDDHEFWGEPSVGGLFGEFYFENSWQRKLDNKNYILGDPNKQVWLNSIRNFVLENVSGRFPTLSANEYLVIKEHSGSMGAPLLMEALPESRMILLVRDPRDVVASAFDARRRGSWNYETNKDDPKSSLLADEDPLAFAEEQATRYLRYVGKAKEAYDAHKGAKVLVRYEELKADTLGTMKRIYSQLGMTVDERQLEQAVQKHLWENIPEEKKGEGKFYRKASPGSWREDLTPEQVEVVEEITAPLLKELYSA